MNCVRQLPNWQALCYMPVISEMVDTLSQEVAHQESITDEQWDIITHVRALCDGWRQEALTARQTTWLDKIEHRLEKMQEEQPPASTLQFGYKW